VKIVTQETADVALESNDADKTNQRRASWEKLVKKTILVDDDEDADYDILTDESYYIFGDKNFKFFPDAKGFSIAFDSNENESSSVGRAWTTSINGNCIVRGQIENSIGYFDKNGNFVENILIRIFRILKK